MSAPLRHPAVHAAGLFALNLFIVLPWLGVEWLDRMGSIEGTFIGLARYRLEHFGEGGWFPLWYLGMPLENTYPPLVPGLSALTAWLFEVSPAWAYHVVTGLFYALGPAGLYWLLRRLGSGAAAAIAGGLAFSVLSPAAWLLPSVAADLGEVWQVRRLYNLTVYGEGPHVAAVSLLFVALALLDRALERRTAPWIFSAAVAVSSVALTNWLGAFALAWAALGILLAQDRPLRATRAAIAAGGWAYALAVIWIPPSTVAMVQRNSQISGAAYPMNAAKVVVLLLLVGALPALALWMGRRGVAKVWRFLLVFAPPMIALPLLEEALGVAIVPQPHRYQLELEAAVLMVLIAVGTLAIRRIPAGWHRPAAAAGFVLVAAQVWLLHGWARELSPELEIESSIEHQVARRLAEDYPGERVFSTGSVRLWMSAFADVPQFGGGFGQGVGFPEWWTVDYGLQFAEGEPELLIDWLRAYGVDILWAGEPGSREHFNLSKDSDKFRGLLPELWRDGGDVLYRIPRRVGLAHVVPRDALLDRSPYNVFDSEPMRKYLAAIEDQDGGETSLHWSGAGEAVLNAVVGPGDVISVQIPYDSRWKALYASRPVATFADNLGLLVIEPLSPGPVQFELYYGRPAWLTLLWIAAWLAGLAVVVRVSFGLISNRRSVRSIS